MLDGKSAGGGASASFGGEDGPPSFGPSAGGSNSAPELDDSIPF